MNVPMNCVGNVILQPENAKYFDGVSFGGYAPPINFALRKLTQTKKQWFVKRKTITDTNDSKCTEFNTITKNSKYVMTDCKALITPQWYVVPIVPNLALHTNIVMQSAIIHSINTRN